MLIRVCADPQAHGQCLVWEGDLVNEPWYTMIKTAKVQRRATVKARGRREQNEQSREGSTSKDCGGSQSGQVDRALPSKVF